MPELPVGQRFQYLVDQNEGQTCGRSWMGPALFCNLYGYSILQHTTGTLTMLGYLELLKFSTEGLPLGILGSKKQVEKLNLNGDINHHSSNYLKSGFSMSERHGSCAPQTDIIIWPLTTAPRTQRFYTNPNKGRFISKESIGESMLFNYL